MELKDYQQKALEQVNRYLELLSEWRKNEVNCWVNHLQMEILL